jgi:hypothetical protein
MWWRLLPGLLVAGLLALGSWTQVLAHQYGYHALLGTPWWQRQVFRHPLAVYAPWQALVWTWRWGTPAWRVGFLAGTVGLGLLLVGAGWRGRWRRRTQPPPMTGHGTTIWATRRDVKKAGLL